MDRILISRNAESVWTREEKEKMRAACCSCRKRSLGKIVNDGIVNDQ